MVTHRTLAIMLRVCKPHGKTLEVIADVAAVELNL